MFINYRLTALFISAIIFILSCKKDEDFVSVTTLNIEIPDDGGVILKGELTKFEEVENHGFYLSEDSLLRSKTTFSLDKPNKSGTFIFELNSGLRRNVRYFFQAFIKTKSKFMFGAIKSFTSAGNKPPVIKSVFPGKAHIKDTVIIYGQNFGSSMFNNPTITIGDKYCYVLKNNDTSVVFQIPENISSYNFRIKITASDKSDSIAFMLYKPHIQSFSSTEFTYRDTIRMYGDHFDLANSRNQVRIGNVLAKVVKSSRTQIDFIMPDQIDKTFISVILYSQLQFAIGNETLKLKTPLITTIPSNSESFVPLTIEGRYFNPVYYWNDVLFENVKAKITSGNANRLMLEVPFGPYPRGKASVKFRFSDNEINSGYELEINDPWLMISNTLPFIFYRSPGTFSLGDKAFVVANSRAIGDANFYLWEFNEETYSWSKYMVPAGIGDRGICISAPNKGYYYTEAVGRNFWEFDPITKEWTPKADFPGVVRGGPATFYVNGNVYIGIGGSSQEEPLWDFYKYNTSTDTWSRVSDLVTDLYWDRSGVSTFVINNLAYIAGGASSSGTMDCWKYNPANDQWSKIADFPYAIHSSTSFVVDGKGYIATGSILGGTNRCWAYDPLKGIWAESYNIGYNGRYGGFAFVLNNHVYIGGGDANFNDEYGNYELYKLNR